MTHLPFWARVASALGLLACWLIAIGVAVSDFGRGVELRLSDSVWAAASHQSDESRFVFIDIDEQTLARLGGWPWPRARVADLIDKAREAGITALTIDGVFPERKENDFELLESLRQDPAAVSSVVFALPGNEQVRVGKLPASSGGELCALNVFPEATGFVANAETLPSLAGHITPRLDADGVTRATPAFVCFEDEAYPSLALKAFLQATGLGNSIAVRSGGFFGPSYQLVLDASLELPLDAAGSLVVPYLSLAESFDRVSGVNVLAGQAALDGRWAILGSSAVGLSDRVTTPLSPLEAGALVHLRLLQGMLDDRLPRMIPAINALFWLVAWTVSLGLVVIGATGKLRWWVAPLGVVIFAAASFTGAVGLRGSSVILAHLVGPNLFVIQAGVLATAIAVVQYRVDRSELIARLGAYLPAQVARQIADGQAVGSVDMVRKPMVLMTVDLRNFDRWAERLEARLSAAVLHHYVCAVSDRIEASGGVVLQVSGSRVRAMWPVEYSADEILRSVHGLLNEVDGSFPDLEVDPELPAMGLAIGLEQGEVLMGTYGSASSRGFSVLGDVAMMVQGLSRMTGELSASCLVGPVFGSRVPEHAKQSLGTFLLEESSVPRELFEITQKAVV